MRRWKRSTLAMLSFSAVVASTQAAAADQQSTRRVVVTAASLMRLADEYSRRGLTEEARRILILLTQNPDPVIRNEARYRQALLLEAQGNDTAAAVLLRRILDERPQATPARLKLATMLQKMGDEEAALRELRALRSIDLPPGVARFVDRLTASVQATKPFGVQVEMALAPDSNINHATRSNTLGTIFGDFMIDEDSRARSGVGAAFRGLAHGRIGLSGDLALAGRASVDASVYRHTDFNDITVELAAGPEWRLGRFRLRAEAAAGHRWYGMKPYQRSVRLAAAALAPIGTVSQLRLDVSGRQVDNLSNDLQDGHGVSAQLRFERALSPRLLVSASVGADRYKARDGAYSTRAWQAGIAAYREIASVTLSTELTIGRLESDERLQLFPEARSDRFRHFAVGAVFRRLSVGGFAPVTRLVIEHNRSSIEFYDYKRTRTEFGISRAF